MVSAAATDHIIQPYSILDITALLEPIAEDAPTGKDLRVEATATSAYHALRDARTAARNNERSALADGEVSFISISDWAPVLETVPQLLSEQSKDLELVAWLIEALTRIHGFAGVREGFALARFLIERFGDALYPLPDEDGKTTQLAALIGLNGYGGEGALISPLKSIPLTEGSPPAPFASWQCEQAFELERIADPAKREARSKRGFITRAELDKAVAETPSEFLQKTAQALQETLTEYALYQQALDAYCEDDPQPTARIHETLSACLQTLTYLAGDRLQPESATATEEASAEGNDSAAPESSPSLATRGGLDRQEALRQLEDVANFFRRTEPHSPVSYAIEQAVYWSKLPLPELLDELIPDDGARQKYHQLVGIRSIES